MSENEKNLKKEKRRKEFEKIRKIQKEFMFDNMDEARDLMDRAVKMLSSIPSSAKSRMGISSKSQGSPTQRNKKSPKSPKKAVPNKFEERRKILGGTRRLKKKV